MTRIGRIPADKAYNLICCICVHLWLIKKLSAVSVGAIHELSLLFYIRGEFLIHNSQFIIHNYGLSPRIRAHSATLPIPSMRAAIRFETFFPTAVPRTDL